MSYKVDHKVYPVLDELSQDIRRAVNAGDTKLAAHLAGVARSHIDPLAPVPDAPKAEEPQPKRRGPGWC